MHYLITMLPLKNSEYRLKFKSKPRITPGLQKSISIKNKLLTKYTKMKDTS